MHAEALSCQVFKSFLHLKNYTDSNALNSRKCFELAIRYHKKLEFEIADSKYYSYLTGLTQEVISKEDTVVAAAAPLRHVRYCGSQSRVL